MKVAAYCRVSTKGKGQDPNNQVHKIKEYCKNMNYEIYDFYIDHEKGEKYNRKEFTRMMKDSKKNKFKSIIVWKMDRFSREKVGIVFSKLYQLESQGIGFISISEPFLSTLGEFKDLLIPIIAWVNNYENKVKSERIKLAYEKKKSNNDVEKWGRPTKEFDTKKVDQLKKQGFSLRQITDKINNGKRFKKDKISYGTIRRYLLQKGGKKK